MGEQERIHIVCSFNFLLQGRNGLGNIFVFAAGNFGGYFYESCTASGLIESIYTIPVGSYNENGGPATYDEKCSAKMTVAYVQNTRNESLQVVRTDYSMMFFTV